MGSPRGCWQGCVLYTPCLPSLPWQVKRPRNWSPQWPNILALQAPSEALTLCSKGGTQEIRMPKKTLGVTCHCGLSGAAVSRMRAIWPFRGWQDEARIQELLAGCLSVPSPRTHVQNLGHCALPSCSPHPTPARAQARGQVGFRGFRSCLRTWWALRASEEVAFVGTLKAPSSVWGGTNVTADRHTPVSPHQSNEGLLAEDSSYTLPSYQNLSLAPRPTSIQRAHLCLLPGIPVLGLRTTVLSLFLSLAGCLVSEGGSFQDLLSFPSA